MPLKRPSDEFSNGAVKHLKTEQPAEFSNAVKKRLASSTRTGQACDRCKVRKIRCDGLPGGCSPCLQNNTECFTTDRITGRATSRGYTEGLEQQIRDLQHRNRELEQLLVNIKSSNGYHGVTTSTLDMTESTVQAPPWNPAVAASYSTLTSVATVNPQPPETKIPRTQTPVVSASSAPKFLGISSGNSNLSSIKGTALSILGMEIDIADFTSVDLDEPEKAFFHPQLYNKSYQSFLQTALNINPRIDKVDLPDKQEGLTYAEWYFRVINPYVPLLHKPSFMKLLLKIYNEPSFRPTIAQTVLVHMVFAIMLFQFAARNREDSGGISHLDHRSNMHYHHCLGLLYQLLASHTAEDCQALALICTHLRNFPKPGASWILVDSTMAMAIELGLHRSPKKWAADSQRSPLDIEMRKRTFWTLLAIHVTLSGKLGRPMRLRVEDFDVEIPEPVDDELLSDEGLATSSPGQCHHEIGLEGWKLLPLYMDLYSVVYAVRKQTESYISTITSLEARIRHWKESLPLKLVRGESGRDDSEGAIFALYGQMYYLEFRLLMRHPSVWAPNSDQAFNAESMRICVESSRQMLPVVRQLQKYKSLDTTWYNGAVYVMAITTTLFAQWEKRDDISSADIAALKEEMYLWLDIMDDVGRLLGSGNRLRECIQKVIDNTLGLINNSSSSKISAFPHKASSSLEQPPTSPKHQSISKSTEAKIIHRYRFQNNPSSHEHPTSSYVKAGNDIHHQQTLYPTSAQYTSYPETSSTSIPYTPQPNPHSYTHNYSNSTESAEGPLLAALTDHTPQSPNTDVGNWPRHEPQSFGSQAWHQWTNTVTENLQPQECYSATALIQLGGRETANGGDEKVGNNVPDISGPGRQGATLNQDQDLSARHSNVNVSSDVAGNTWPLNLFDLSHGSNDS